MMRKVTDALEARAHKVLRQDWVSSFLNAGWRRERLIRPRDPLFPVTSLKFITKSLRSGEKRRAPLAIFLAGVAKTI